MKFEQSVMFYDWEEQFLGKTVDQKVELFHKVLRTNLDKYFPEKSTKMSSLDKDWMSPQLKQIHRSMQREFFKIERAKNI